jgi:asparagine synthase (glutamine-hydrolysing)
MTPHFVAVERSTPAAQIDQMVAAIGEPFPAPTLYILWALYQEASRQGIEVIFDGLDGDTAVHHGDAYLAELARSSQWPHFFQLATAIVRRKKLASLDPLMRRYGEPYLASLAAGWQWGQLRRELHALSSYSTTSTRHLFYRYVRDHSLRPLAGRTRSQVSRLLGVDALPSHHALGLVNRRLLRQSDLRDYLHERRQSEQAPASARQEHYQQLTTPLLPQLFEISTRTARAFDIDARHPFTDRRLVEFCYALPPQQKVVDGWTRHVVRRALSGVIPEAIRLRGDKSQNSLAVTKGFLQDAGQIEGRLNRNSERLADYVDITLLKQAFQRYRSNGNEEDELLIWQTATLAVWLEQNASPCSQNLGRDLETQI